MREWLVSKIKQLRDENNITMVLNGEVVESDEIEIYKKVLVKYDELN